MENDTPVPDEKKPKFDPQSGEVEPSPSRVEGARVMANETDEELERKTALEEPDVRRLAEDYVETRGADDAENFKDYAEDRATRARSSSP